MVGPPRTGLGQKYSRSVVCQGHEQRCRIFHRGSRWPGWRKL